MKLRKSLALIVLLFAGMLSAHAQVGSAVVTAAANFSVASTDTITFKAQIVSCGNGQLPLYNGVPISLTPNQTPSAPFTASNTGSAQSVTFTVPGNDKIICGSQAYTTYAVTWYDNGFPLAPTQTYRFTDATTQSLANLVPVSFVPPVLTNAAGALCPAATPIFTGFNNNYQIQCAANAPSSTAALPITGGTLQGSLTIPSPFLGSIYSVVAQFQNGIPQADQFAGADMCAKVNTALLYAISNNLPYVDATHFVGTQVCASNMFANLSVTPNAAVNVSLLFGNVHVQSTVVQTLIQSNIGIYGLGPQSTQIEYTGASGAAAVMVINGTTGTGTLGGNGINNVIMKGIFFYGGASNVADGLLIQFVNRSKFEDISAWGATSDAIEVQGAVTNTYIRLHSSAIDAFYLGIQTGHATPQNGLVFGGYAAGGIDSTASTIVDPMAEGVSATGIFLKSAANLTFTGGTSELNSRGIVVNPTSAGVNPGTSNKGNSFFGTDLEANTLGTSGVDVTDNGQQNYYFNLVAASSCASCNSMLAGTGAGQYIFGEALLKTGFTGTFNVIGVQSNFAPSGGNTNFLSTGTVTSNNTQVNSQQVIVSGGLALLSAPILTSNGVLPTCAQGTGVTTCAVTAGSTQSRGFLTITNASATTSQVLATLTFTSSLAGVPFCQLSQAAGTTYLGLFSNSTTAAHFTIVNTQTVSGVTTIQLGYACQL